MAMHSSPCWARRALRKSLDAKDTKGFADNRIAAKEGGTIAGDARKALEAKSGKPVVSKENYLAPPVAAVLKDADAAAPPAKRKAINRLKKANEGKA